MIKWTESRPDIPAWLKDRHDKEQILRFLDWLSLYGFFQMKKDVLGLLSRRRTLRYLKAMAEISDILVEEKTLDRGTFENQSKVREGTIRAAVQEADLLGPYKGRIIFWSLEEFREESFFRLLQLYTVFTDFSPLDEEEKAMYTEEYLREVWPKRSYILELCGWVVLSALFTALVLGAVVAACISPIGKGWKILGCTAGIGALAYWITQVLGKSYYIKFMRASRHRDIYRVWGRVKNVYLEKASVGGYRYIPYIEFITYHSKNNQSFQLHSFDDLDFKTGSSLVEFIFLQELGLIVDTRGEAVQEVEDKRLPTLQEQQWLDILMEAEFPGRDILLNQLQETQVVPEYSEAYIALNFHPDCGLEPFPYESSTPVGLYLTDGDGYPLGEALLHIREGYVDYFELYTVNSREMDLEEITQAFLQDPRREVHSVSPPPEEEPAESQV